MPLLKDVLGTETANPATYCTKNLDSRVARYYARWHLEFPGFLGHRGCLLPRYHLKRLEGAHEGLLT